MRGRGVCEREADGTERDKVYAKRGTEKARGVSEGRSEPPEAVGHFLYLKFGFMVPL